MMFGGRSIWKVSSYFQHQVITEFQSLPTNLYVEELQAACDRQAEHESKIHSDACFNKSNMQQ